AAVLEVVEQEAAALRRRERRSRRSGVRAERAFHPEPFHTSGIGNLPRPRGLERRAIGDGLAERERGEGQESEGNEHVGPLVFRGGWPRRIDDGFSRRGSAGPPGARRVEGAPGKTPWPGMG